MFLHNQVDKSTKVGWADAGGSKWNVRTDGMLEPLHHLTEGVVRVFGWENNQPKMVNLGASSALTFTLGYHHDPPPPSPLDVGAIVGITITLGMRVMDMGPNTALSLSLSLCLSLFFSLFLSFAFSLAPSLSFSCSLSPGHCLGDCRARVCAHTHVCALL